MILLIVILVCGSSIALSQTASDKFRNYFKDKNFDEAAKYIKDASAQNPKDFNLHLIMGDVYMELEKYDNALELYRLANDIERNRPVTLRKIGRANSRLGKHDEAIKILQDAVKRDNKDVLNHVELGHAYIAAGKLEDARLVITQAAQMRDDVPDAFLALGDLYFAQKVYELAKSNYEKALSLDPNLTQARESLATAYYWLANGELDDDLANELFARSLKEWDMVTQQDPKNAKAFFEKGKILYFSGRYRPAAGTLLEYINLRPSGSLGRWYLAQCFYEVGACDSAAPHLLIVQNELDSVNIKAKFMLARCYYDQSNHKKSIAEFVELRKSETLDQNDLMRLASSYLNTGDTMSAIGIWEEVIAIDPSQCRLAMSVGQLLLRTKDYDRAIANFDKVILNGCEAERVANAQFMKGISYIYAENAEMALEPLRQSLLIDSLNLTTYIFLGDAHTKLSMSDSAKYYFEYVMDRASQDTAQYSSQLKQAFVKLSGLLLDEKNFNVLKRVAKKQVDIFPDDVYANLYYAVAFQGSSEVENACRYYRRVLKIEPDNPTAKSNLSALNCP